MWHLGSHSRATRASGSQIAGVLEGVQHRGPQGTRSQARCFPAQWLACPGPIPAWYSSLVHQQLALREHTGRNQELAGKRPNSDLSRGGGAALSQPRVCATGSICIHSQGVCPLLPQRCLRSRWHRSTSLVPPRGTAPSHEIFPGYSGAPYPFWAQQLPLPRALIHTRLCRSAQNPLAQSFLDFSHFPTHQHHLCDH